ncbi:hypothetical protein B0T17DRAFT_200432 [Bombardia bombarda]|uniref:Uncharacterized protein n=1 Tax=Bombardia bombarda TaxID=252184 RepID=A0AA39XA05_9PEZI|nr:hypothetical protein B0T17DRAFT_200432 [Bombardia bombarda]
MQTSSVIPSSWRFSFQTLNSTLQVDEQVFTYYTSSGPAVVVPAIPTVPTTTQIIQTHKQSYNHHTPQVRAHYHHAPFPHQHTPQPSTTADHDPQCPHES